MSSPMIPRKPLRPNTYTLAQSLPREAVEHARLRVNRLEDQVMAAKTSFVDRDRAIAEWEWALYRAMADERELEIGR